MRSRDMYWPAKSSFPDGYTPGTALLIPRSSGGLASQTQLTGAISTTASLAVGIPIDSALSASISITNAILQIIVALDAAITASGTITNAQLAIILQLESALSGSGTITTAELGNILNLLSSLSATMTLTTNITNLVNLEAAIGGAPELSPQGLSEELLDNQNIENGYSLRQSLRLALASLAGKVSGAATSTVTIRSITDGTDRIVATVDSSGNRTAVTYDVADE